MRLSWLVVLALAGSPLALAPTPTQAAAPPAAATDAPATPAAAPATDAAAPAAASPPPVATLRADMEADMAALGEIAESARRDTDLVRAACVLDKQERGQSVMELGTAELLVIRDPAATDQQRRFAAEKLQAAAERLDGLVQAARECSGDKSPEVEDDKTDNDADEVPLVPEADPTQSGGAPPQPGPVPPSVDDQRPPTVGSPAK